MTTRKGMRNAKPGNKPDYVDSNLNEILEDDLPPRPDQIITYTVDGDGTLHHRCCDEVREGVVAVTTTTGKDLQRSFEEHGVERACDEWFRGRRKHAELLMRRWQTATNASALKADVRLMLYYEAQKPGTVDAWCRWFSGLSAAQLREKGRKALAWDLDQHETQVACFKVNINRETSWIVGLGTHAACPAKFGERVTVYGLVPERVAVEHQIHEDAYVVPVGPGFSEAMFNVAVNLYQTWGAAVATKETAVRAIQTAELAIEQ